MIEGYNLELLPFGRDQYISSSPPRLNLRVQKIKEQSDQIHLPIMHGSDKRNIPLKVHMICHQSLFTAGNTKQLWKIGLQGMILTPQIKPKLYLGSISHLISDKSIKHPHPERTNNLLEHHPPLILSYLVSITDLHNTSLSMAKHHNHFPKRAS
jgi:hypothetical protein